jgi:hypothetical protein
MAVPEANAGTLRLMSGIACGTQEAAPPTIGGPASVTVAPPELVAVAPLEPPDDAPPPFISLAPEEFEFVQAAESDAKSKATLVGVFIAKTRLL